MPTRRDAEVLVDTSVAVVLSLADHEHHDAVVGSTRGRRLGLAGHAAFETFSVLTRLPVPSRRSATVVARLLSTNFPATHMLGADAAAALFASFGGGGLAGGSVYDALVAAAAKERGVPLATLNRRALDTYRLVGAEIKLIV